MNEPDEATLRMLLLGSASMVLATVLGYVSFHAACVIINNKAVLFCGKSGKGKSSLAVYFHSKGYTVLSDDVTNIKLSETGELIAYASVPRAKLSETVLQRMGKSKEGLTLIPTKNKKYSLPLSLPSQTNYPVSGVVFPEFYSGENKIEPIKGTGKLKELVRHLYRNRTARLLNLAENKNRVLFTMVLKLNMYYYKRCQAEEAMQDSLLFVEKELTKL